jgi:Uma2 family endonuclease
MIANPQAISPMAAEEYLVWEASQELRYEYIDGQVIAMTGGSIPHNDIALNFYTLLRPHLRAKGCRVNVTDVKVQARTNSRYFYPDLVITCDAEDLTARDFVKRPKIIIEVLSPSTESYDRTQKLKYYRQIPTLQAYVLVASEEMSVEVYQRSEGKMWLYDQYETGEAIALPSIEFECPIELIYESIVFDQI